VPGEGAAEPAGVHPGPLSRHAVKVWGTPAAHSRSAANVPGE